MRHYLHGVVAEKLRECSVGTILFSPEVGEAQMTVAPWDGVEGSGAHVHIESWPSGTRAVQDGARATRVMWTTLLFGAAGECAVRFAFDFHPGAKKRVSTFALALADVCIQVERDEDEGWADGEAVYLGPAEPGNGGTGCLEVGT